jgi:Bacterial Ig-like domain (group 3)/MBG domain (YGX type)
MRLRWFIALVLVLVFSGVQAFAKRADLPSSDDGEVQNTCDPSSVPLNPNPPQTVPFLSGQLTNGKFVFSPAVSLASLPATDSKGNTYTVHVDAYNYGFRDCSTASNVYVELSTAVDSGAKASSIFFVYVVDKSGNQVPGLTLTSFEISLPLNNPGFVVCRSGGYQLCNMPPSGNLFNFNSDALLQPTASSGADGTGTAWSFGPVYDTSTSTPVILNSNYSSSAFPSGGQSFSVGTGSVVLAADGTVQCPVGITTGCNGVTTATPYSLTFVPSGGTPVTVSSSSFPAVPVATTASANNIQSNPISLASGNFASVYNTSTNLPTEANGVPSPVLLNGVPSTALKFSCPSSQMQEYRPVWFLYTPPASTQVYLSTIGSHYDTVLGVTPSGTQPFPSCDDDPTPNVTGLVTSNLSFQASKGTTYQILVTEDAPATESDGDNYIAPLSGDPTLYFALSTPQLLTSPGSLTDFGSVTIGQSAPTQTITLTSSTKNFGSVGVSAIAAIIAPGGDFQITSANCTSPLPDSGPACPVTVKFTPAAAGTRTATLTITSSGATAAVNTPITFQLSGTGVAPAPVVGLSPATALTFPGQSVNTSSNISNVVVTNSGTAALTVSSVTATGDFSQTNNCTTTPVAAPGFCTIMVTFKPTTSGTRTGLLTVTDNAPAAGSQQQVTLTGTGIATPTITWNTPTAITYGITLSAFQLNATASVGGAFVYSPVAGTVLTAGSHPLSVTFTPTDTIDYTTATSSVTLLVNPAPLTVTAAAATRKYGVANPSLTATATGTVNNDVLTASATTTATTTSPVGSYAIVPAVTGSAIANYSVTLVNGTLSVTQAASAAAVSASASSVSVGASLTFTATVASTTSGTPTGTVQFLNGSSVLGTGTLSSGVATFTTTALAAGTYVVTASYAGDANFSSSISSAAPVTVVAPDYSITSNPTSLTIKQGQSGTATFTVTPVGGFNQTITFACAGLPSGANCSFSPATVTPNGTAVTSLLTITTTAPTAMLSRPLPWKNRDGSLLALLVGIFAGCSRKRFRIRVSLLLLVSALALFSVTGCGGGSSNSSGSTGNPGTPTGTSQITVSASAGGATVHSASLTVIVTN